MSCKDCEEKEYERLERQITSFTDCGSKCVVLRMPYELAIMLVKNCPECDDKIRLIRAMNLSAGRSNSFITLLKENGLWGQENGSY